MRSVALVAILAATGCSSSTLRHGNRVGLGAAVMTIACDWGHTRAAAGRGWMDQHEANPILGRSPSVGEVDLYMASAIGITAIAWWLLPERARPFLSGAVIVKESMSITANTGTRNAGLCGFSGDPVR